MALLFLLAGCAKHQSVGTNLVDGGGSVPDAGCLTDEDCPTDTWCLYGSAVECTAVRERAIDCECVPVREIGEPCGDVSQCRDRDGWCGGPQEGQATCHPPEIGEERCTEDLDCTSGRVCAQSYCLLRRGEHCSASSECASNRCYGTSPLDYACL